MQLLPRDRRVQSAPDILSRLKHGQIRQIIEHRAYRIAYQPLFRLRDSKVEGLECLTRFDSEPPQPPDEWFQQADEVGLGVELELSTLESALANMVGLASGPYLSLNVSPAVVLDGRLAELLSRRDPRQIVLEITEHTNIPDYAPICDALKPLRRSGIRLAVDDVGAGYSSMRHILNLQPDLMKLDVSLTRHIDTCPARAALIIGLIHFARSIGAGVVAEGVETVPQLSVLRALGVDIAQGFLLGRPLFHEPS